MMIYIVTKKNFYDYIYDQLNECLMQLNNNINKVVDYNNLYNIEDCIKECNEDYIHMPKTVESKFYTYYIVKWPFYYALYLDLHSQNNVLGSYIRALQSKIQSCAKSLKSLFEHGCINFKNYDSECNKTIKKNLIEFEQRVIYFCARIKKVPNLQLRLQQNDVQLNDWIESNEELIQSYRNIIDFHCESKQRGKQYIEKLYYEFKKINNVYNDYVNLYTTLKTKSKQCNEVMTKYKTQIDEFYTILQKLAVEIDDRNILKNMLCPILSPIFKLFLSFK